VVRWPQDPPRRDRSIADRYRVAQEIGHSEHQTLIFTYVQAKTNAKIAVLHEKMDAIHYANSLYWKHGNEQTKAARAQYQWHQDRLEKIREELAILRGSPPTHS
jgi:hypothetical protein